MKKILVLLLALSLCFMASCGGKNPSGNNNGGNGSGEDIYMTILDAGMGTAWADALADAYYEETGVTVHVEADADLISGIENKMNVNGEKDDIYFVAAAQSNWNRWINRGKIVDITDVLADDTYGVPANERAADATIEQLGKYSDKNYLLPYVYSMWGLVYNQGLLNKIDSYGEYVKGEWPETMQGLIDLCAATKAANITNTRTGRTVSPFSCGLNVNYMDYLFFSLWEAKDPAGYRAYWDQDNRAGYDVEKLQTTAVQSSFEIIFDLIDAEAADGNVVSNLVSASQNHLESQTSFVNGDAVFTFTGSWYETEMKEIMDQVGMTDYHFAAYPAVTAGGDKSALLNMPGEYFFIPTDAVNVSGAKDFLAFCISEKGSAIVSKALNQQCAFTTEESVTLSSFGTEVKNVMATARHAFMGSSTSEVYLSGALKLFSQTVNPFIQMAKGSVTAKSQIYEKCIATEIQQHQSLWNNYMENLG